MWNADRLEIKGLIERDGQPQGEISLDSSGQPSRFTASLPLEQPGDYQVMVFAFDPNNGNCGLDRAVFSVG